MTNHQVRLKCTFICQKQTNSSLSSKLFRCMPSAASNSYSAVWGRKDYSVGCVGNKRVSRGTSKTSPHRLILGFHKNLLPQHETGPWVWQPSSRQQVLIESIWKSAPDISFHCAALETKAIHARGYLVRTMGLSQINAFCERKSLLYEKECQNMPGRVCRTLSTQSLIRIQWQNNVGIWLLESSIYLIPIEKFRKSLNGR